MPSRSALIAASLMCSGVSQSGSPISRCTMDLPWRSRSRARARTSKAVSVPRWAILAANGRFIGLPPRRTPNNETPSTCAGDHSAHRARISAHRFPFGPLASCRDARSRLAGQRPLDALRRGNQCFVAARLHKLQRGADLRSHAAWCEVSLAEVALGVVDGHYVQIFLVWLAVMQRDPFYGGRDQQQVGTDGLSEQGAGEILVDDRLDAGEIP